MPRSVKIFKPISEVPNLPESFTVKIRRDTYRSGRLFEKESIFPARKSFSHQYFVLQHPNFGEKLINKREVLIQVKVVPERYFAVRNKVCKEFFATSLGEAQVKAKKAFGMQRLRNIEVEKVGALSDYSISLREGYRARVIKQGGHFFPLNSTVIINSISDVYEDTYYCIIEYESLDFSQSIRSDCLELIR